MQTVKAYAHEMTCSLPMHQVTHLVGSYPRGFYMFYNNKYLSNFNNENIDIRIIVYMNESLVAAILSGWLVDQ